MRNTILCSFFLLVVAATAVRAQSSLYIQSSGDTLTVVPSAYVTDFSMEGNDAFVELVTGKTLVVPGAENITRECPVELPRFASYRFNDKPNDQLFQSVAASEQDLARNNIQLSVAQIGKWLTATFQLTDEDAVAWVGSVRQKSKVTRQRMENPVTYTIGHTSWRELQVTLDERGENIYRYIPFGRKVTVSVDFLTDHPTIDYNVPRIDITTDNGSVPMSKTIYNSGTITIDGGGVYPDMPTTDIQIKGRGNSSWSNSSYSKNPYHFKFEEKQKPLGMKAGKHWILLANKQTGSMMTNALEQKASALAGCAAVCHIVPVELYINGDYRGSYNLTEKVGIHNNSVELDDESCAAMLELDTYEDEQIWKRNAYSVCTKIHDPDFDEENLAIGKPDIITDWTNALKTLHDGKSEDYTGRFDVNYLVSYLFANELCYNSELQHPKSVFLYSENVLDDGFSLTGIDETPWIFGPMWDCDWSFGWRMQGNDSYFAVCAESGYYKGWVKNYVNGLWYDLRYKSQAVDKAYFTLCHNFLNDGRLEELIDYVQDYYDYAAPSLRHDIYSSYYSWDWTDYESQAVQAATWFRKRANYIYRNLTAYDIEEEPEEAFATPFIIDGKDGIDFAMQDEEAASGDWYDLSGRRVRRDENRRTGIYILPGGRKVLVP